MKRIPNGLLPYLTSIILCVVVVIQSFLVRFESLSPWKGGGFGMFSTIDSPSARFIRAYLITDGTGVISVTIPPHLQELEREVRSLPTEARAHALGNELLSGTWIPLQFSPSVDQYRELVSGSSDTHEAVNFEHIQLYRMLAPHEVDYSPIGSLNVQSIRIEILKYSFEVSSKELTSFQVLDITIEK